MSTSNILIVEDDPDHRELLRTALSAGSSRSATHIAASGDDAVRAIQEHGKNAFDCVVLDFNLVSENATQLLPRLRAAGCKCPTMIISSSDAQETVIKSLRCGSVDFVPKSEAFRGTHLKERTELAIAGGRRKEETRRKSQRRAQHLTELAERDPLTGLSNRRSLDRLFSRHRKKIDRRGPVSIAMIDLDHFKRINDQYGHQVGDRVLCLVASAIRESVARGDVVCRYGGEEFVVIRPSTPYAEVLHWAETLRVAIEGLACPAEVGRIPVTVSLGLMRCSSKDLSPNVLARVDRAMYLAKASGRNRTCLEEMVAFHEAARAVRQTTNESLDSRLQALLQWGNGRLGPTQLAHLTTHAAYVSRMSIRLGKALRMGSQNIERLRVAGLFHDLGKFVIPEEVLAKPEPLTVAESAMVGRHAEDGAGMASLLGVDRVTAEFIRYHHARFDRRGAIRRDPDRTVHLGAGILAVADAFVTMTSYRPYQPVRSFVGAVGELQKQVGKQFDPDVVSAVPHALLTEVPEFVTRITRSRNHGMASKSVAPPGVACGLPVG